MKKKSFVRRALVSIFLVSMLAVGVSSFIFFWQEREMALDYAKTLQSEELSWSKSIIDQNINIADELFKGLQADRSLFQLIKNFDSKKRSPTATNREFKEIVSSHLPYTNQIHAVQLFRSDFVLYSKNPTLASIYNTKNVEFIMKAQNTDHVFWVPTYDFTKAYNHTLIQNYPIKHRWIFSLVGKMEPYSFNQSRLEYLSDTTERPILAISFNEEWLMNCLPERKYPNAVSFIVNDTGEYLTHTQRDLLGEPVLEELADVFKKEREKGEEKIEYNKQQNLLFFNTLDNGWKIATLVPMEDILADAIRGIYQPFFIVTPIIALLCLLLSWSISRALSKPLRQLTAAIKQVEHGDFDVFLPDTHDEFSLVMNSYNSMTKRIEELIEENYQTRNHEQEKEMMALRYQTNPHFLYNALNILHMNAIKENSRGTADLILLLSQVMRYIIRDQRDIVTVREEIDNVQKYFRLISVGYEQRIQLEIDFQQAVLEYPIPKLSIQPLVENAVQHGLGNVNRNGLIRITGKLIDNGLYIYIEDNGQGMKSETDPLHETDRGSIGMANVAKRIRFLFGENSSLTVAQSQLGGVMITICLSYDMKNI